MTLDSKIPGGPLADGLIGGNTLVCPLHSWKFDLSTGEALSGDCGIKTYSVRVDEAGRILLTLACMSSLVCQAVVMMHMPDVRSASTDIPMHRGIARMVGTASSRW